MRISTSKKTHIKIKLILDAFGQGYGYNGWRDTQVGGIPGGIPSGDVLDKVKTTAACIMNCFKSFFVINPASGQPRLSTCKSLSPCLRNCVFPQPKPSRLSYRSVNGLSYDQYAMMYDRQLRTRSSGSLFAFDIIPKFLTCMKDCLIPISKITSFQQLSNMFYCWINTCVCKLNQNLSQSYY